MAKIWWKVGRREKIHVTKGAIDAMGMELYICGLRKDTSLDAIIGRKPRKGDFCKNCLRIDNK